MPLKNLIANIIEVRNERVKELKEKRKKLDDIRKNLYQIQEKAAIYLKDTNFDRFFECNQGLKRLLQEPELLRKMIEAYEKAIREFDRLISRFERQSVNISVIGDSRAGKSKFLQIVSGLKDEPNSKCIPSFDGSFCTGVSSIIENSAKIEEYKVKGVLTFKTEKEIIAEINDKLGRITGDKVQINSLTDVTALSSAQLEKNLSGIYEKGNITDFIEMYVTNYKEWVPFINLTQQDFDKMNTYKLTNDESNEKNFICTDPSELQKYVAKHDGGYDKELKGTDATLLYRYIAVKRVVIYTHFPVTDVSQIRLIDTVGLGDTAVGTTEKMYESIDKESDAVLYFFRPQCGKGGMIDDRTYDILNRQLYPRYQEDHTKWWMAVLINDDGTNTAECERFSIEFEKKAPDMSKNVVFKEIINVTDSEKVRDKCITPLLNSISEHLEELDQRFEKNAREKMAAANRLLTEAQEKILEIQVPALEDIIQSKFKDIFSNFIKSIDELKKKYRGNDENGNEKGRQTFLEESLKRVERLIENKTENKQEHHAAGSALMFKMPKDTQVSDAQQKDAQEKHEKAQITTASICNSLAHISEPDSRRSCALGELQHIVRNIGNRESEELSEIEKGFKKELAELFLEKFEFDRTKCPAPSSDTFFPDMAKRLFGEKKDFELFKDVFLSVHQFKLNETTGITKLLFNEKAEICFTNAEEVNKDIHLENNSSKLDPLVDEMNQRIGIFVEKVTSSELCKNSKVVPISQQIACELSYFLRSFDVIYHREWANVLETQLKKGYIFVNERQEIKELAGNYNDFKSLLDQTFGI